MAYRCPQAITGGAREAIRCKVSGSVCAHQKMCMMEGRIVLTDGAMRCPGRDAEMMAAAAAAEPEVVLAAGLERVELAAAAEPEKKPGRKAAGAKSGKTGAKKNSGKK